ncbi:MULTISPECIES: hypothetical protein [unclassified Shinella]|uniref:hypothetical protein n=1 Tax=unclassified Shinella TaxID=2643062 RepID=UPI00225CFFB7|nr:MULTISPECIES: hypothetical protein [unclassified Shinella]MCO5140036.1 hypothetical protein [Shinella sp.]MDC7256946.1 hypothetical protein [Shinella sp. YE25]CAI0339838.1 conserved exported hypothetical protein [Rhizobiaceae bacterium]CAK7258228.1 conserved exported protein of unknown function [Shinella sp. WSC3-e]
MRAVLVLAGFLAATAASAAECRQDRARYADRDGAYELTFEPVGSDAAATSHHFKLKILASGVVLDGVVMPGDPARSNGMVMHDCPEGDVTGEEIAACTVWEGVIYALDGAGDAGLLPEEGAAAAETLLLSGFGPSVRYSTLWDDGKATVAPWDVFRRKGCAP